MHINLITIVVVIFSTARVTASDEQFCRADKSSCDDDPLNLKHIYNEAIRRWSPTCNGVNCFTSQIDADLGKWSKGISKQSIDQARDYGILYQLIDGVWYRDKSCLFPSRCEGIEYFLNKLNTSSIGDIELVINVHDWPQVHVARHKVNPPPVFSFSKDNLYLDILYPAWAFWAGGPAIDTFPTGIGKWDELSGKISSSRIDWKDKKSQIFFRGSRTSDERDPLILLSRSHRSIIDARYTKNQAWRSIADTLNEEPSPVVSFEEHCKYKYLINLRGVAASFRYKHLFLCKSIVLNVNSEMIEFFYNALQPWVHFVPVKSDMSDLLDTYHFLQANDEIAQDIALRGYNFIHSSLTNERVTEYWQILLTNYAHLLKYKVRSDATLIRV